MLVALDLSLGFEAFSLALPRVMKFNYSQKTRETKKSTHARV
jgi:hypothetical protein